MTELGADYSTARPGGAALRAKGVVAVGRYLASDGRGITAAEYEDLTAHGVGVWVVRETQTWNLSVSMLNGYAKGVADATAALDQFPRVGLPASLPVFWAADFDIAPGSPRVAEAEAYVDGWNTVIPPGRRGGYGGLWFLAYLHGRGKVDFLWECASTSFRHGMTPSQVPLSIRQTTQAPPLPGTDHNEIFDLTPTTLEADMPLTQADIGAIISALLNFPAFDKGPSVSVVLREAHNVYAGLYVGGPSVPGGGSIVGLIDNVPTRVTQAPVDVEAVAQAVIAQLPASGVTVDEVKAAVAEVVGGTKLVAAS